MRTVSLFLSDGLCVFIRVESSFSEAALVFVTKHAPEKAMGVSKGKTVTQSGVRGHDGVGDWIRSQNAWNPGQGTRLSAG